MMAYSERKFEQYFKSCGTGEDEGRQGRNLTGRVENNQWWVDVGPYTKLILPFYLFSPLLLVLVSFHTPVIRRRQKTTKQETLSRKQVLDSPLWAIPIKPHFFSISYRQSSMIIVHSEDLEWKRLHVSLRM